MIKDIREINKELCEKYPYITPRNVWTGVVSENYDYSYTLADMLPEGWKKLFIQMCEDIKEPLRRSNYLDKFRFSQVKEKYGTMRCYDFGASREVHDIIDKYEYLSYYVCEKCGRPSRYGDEEDWIAQYCEECWTPEEDEEFKLIEFKPIYFGTICFGNDKYEYQVDCSDEWRRLYERQE